MGLQRRLPYFDPSLYAGFHVFGRTSRKLYTPRVPSPRLEWVVTPKAFEPVVDPATFDGAQKILGRLTIHQSDNEILDSLRRCWLAEGRLSFAVIENSPKVPSPSTYRNRFGSLQRAYELIGYGCSADFDPVNIRRHARHFATS